MNLKKQIEQTTSTFLPEYQRWSRSIPPLIRGAFSTVTFKETGFSDDFSGSLELHHFGGGQHVDPLPDLCARLGSIVSTEDLVILSELQNMFEELEFAWSRDVSPLLERGYQPVVCRSSLLRSVVSFRAIKLLFAGEEKKILELGSGSGYVSCALSLAGHQVATLDVSVGYNIWQRVLYTFFDNYFATKTAPLALSPPSLYSLAPQLPFLPDVIVANHMLNEMSRHALSMTLESLRRLGASPIFVVDGWGFGSRTDARRNGETENILRWYGYELVYHAPMTGTSSDGQAEFGGEREPSFPISIFKKTREKRLNNVSLGGGEEPTLARDLSSKLETDAVIASKINAAFTPAGVDALTRFFDSSGVTAHRLENLWLDYIGLNSNTKRAYSRQREGRYF